jgi:hypothetical protein
VEIQYETVYAIEVFVPPNCHFVYDGKEPSFVLSESFCICSTDKEIAGVASKLRDDLANLDESVWEVEPCPKDCDCRSSSITFIIERP